MYSVQDGSKSVSLFTLGDSFSDPLLKHTIPITLTLPLAPILDSVELEGAHVARIGLETMQKSSRKEMCKKRVKFVSS